MRYFRGVFRLASNHKFIRQRLSALFFVSVLVFSTLTPLAPWAASVYAAQKQLAPLDQQKHDYGAPTELAAVDDSISRQKSTVDPKSVGDNTEKRPANKPQDTVKFETPLNTRETETTFSDGSLKIRSAAEAINDATGLDVKPLDKLAHEDTDYAKTHKVSNKSLSRLIPGNDTVAARAFKVSSSRLSAEFQTFTGTDGIRLSNGVSDVTVRPVGGADDVVPITKEVGGSTFIIYEDVWKDVDLQYEFTGEKVKEYIVVKSVDAPSVYSYALEGGEIEQLADGSYAIKDKNISIGQLSISVNKQGFVSDPPVKLAGKGKTLSVILDDAWLQAQPKSNFPIFIDPDYYARTDVGGDYGRFVSYKSDGFTCSERCWMNTGSLNQDGGAGLRSWHTGFNVPYNQISGKYLDYAYLHTSMKYAPNLWSGFNENHTVWMSWLPASNYNYGGGGAPVVSGTMGTDNWFDVTSIYRWLQSTGNYGGWLVMWGEEDNMVSFKVLDPSATFVDFYYDDYNSRPTVPGLVAPQDKQVFLDTQPSLTMGASSDANGDALKYWFRVMGSKPANCEQPTNILVDSGEIDTPQWTVPDGVLKDGEKYYFCGYVHDHAENTSHFAGGNYWNWTAPVEFSVDLRLGKDKTQTYDSVGAAGVDFSNGNVTMSASSHTMSAIGGNMGVSLEYNSPVASRSGLMASYFNNTTWSGSPVLSRRDGNLDFNWQTGSPSSGVVGVDNFSARWEGYFVAPAAGAYQFGGNNDDGFIITVKGVQQYGISGCASVCYGTSINLAAGEVAPIKVEYTELTGLAYARLFVKGAVPEQVVPRDWLRTAPQAVRQDNGLTGRYYKLESNEPLALPTDKRQPFMTRLDSSVNFNWGTAAPVQGAPADRFAVRWAGYIMAPQEADYQFCVASDDGMRLTFDGTEYVSAWIDRGGEQTCGATQHWTAGQVKAVTLDYYENGGGAMVNFQVNYLGQPTQTVPTAWLAPGAKTLPNGWTLGIDPDGNVSYEKLSAASAGVTLYDSTGEKHFYTSTGSGYKPPVNEDGNLVRNADGSFTLQDADDRVYEFDGAGLLQRVTTPQDDRQPAALRYEYGGTPARIQKISDGADVSRFVNVYYAGDSQCAAIPSGFDPTPYGVMCAVKSTDGRTTNFYYKSTNLARIEADGGVITDLSYDGSGRISSVREPLASDAILAGVRSSDASVTTEIAYDVLGRAASITAPSPTAGGFRPQRTYDYLRLADASGPGVSQLKNTGASMPNGYVTKVEYDRLLRVTGVYDKTGLKSTTEWDSTKDLPLSSTSSTGLKSTIIYDADDHPIDSYGPAPTEWFGTDRKPLADKLSLVPHTQTAYDEGMTGAAVAWYDFKDINGGVLSGAPRYHTTGFDLAATSRFWMDTTNVSWPGAPITKSADAQGIGFRATSKIYVPTTGTYNLNVNHEDAIRVWVNDSLVLDQWSNRADTIVNSTTAVTLNGGTPNRMTVDYANANNARVAFSMDLSGNGVSTSGAVWNSIMRPGYALATSNKISDSQLGDVTSTTGFGSKPELGQTQSTTIDSGGLNLTTSYTYEPYQVGSLMRQTSKTLPGGNTTTYSYYTVTQTNGVNASEKRANPCVVGSPEVSQAGMQKSKTEPDPDNNPTTANLPGVNAPRTTESVYDATGRVVATRTNNDPWACTTYDSRGRAVTTSVPAINGRTGRTVTNNYAVNGNPLITSNTDSVTGTVTTTYDLLGRVVSTTDVFGYQTSTTYDNLGRITQATSLKGAEVPAYDSYDRITGYALDGTTYATVSYDQYSRIASVTYPQAQSGGNSMQLTQIARDSLQRMIGSNFKFSDGRNFSEQVTLDQQRNLVTGYTNSLDTVQTQPPAPQEYVIYGDALRSGWSKNWSWGSTISLTDTTAPQTGTSDMSWIINSAWGGIHLRSTGALVDTTPYSTLSFAMKASASGAHDIAVFLHDAADNNLGTELDIGIYGGNPNTSGYITYNIPLSALNGVGKQILGVSIEDVTGAAQSKLYVDNIKLTTATSSPITIYNDSLAPGFADWSWGATNNFADTTAPFSGTSAIGTTFTAGFGGLLLQDPNANFNTTGYDYLNFALKGSQAGQVFAVQMTNSNGNNVGQQVNIAQYGGTPNANGYIVYNVPISSFQLPSASVGGVYILNNTNQAQPKIYVDSVTLVPHVAAPATTTQTAGATYTYDKAGRMTSATVDGRQYSYAFGAQASSCTSLAGYNANANKNSNRTSTTVNGVTNNNCYNYADQLINSSDVQIGTPTYDDHGNTTQLAGNGMPITFTYDATDANTKITQGTNRVEYLKSANGTVLQKKEYRNNTLTNMYRYASGVLITCDINNQTSCGVVDKYIGLPGGVSLTLKSSGNVYSILNFHGDTALTVGTTGTPTSSVYLYDPFGQTSPSSTFGTGGYSGSSKDVSNSSNQAMGWAASPTRKSEASDLFSLPIIQMGARVYLPTLGRFLQVDPIEGGTANAYVYATDPVNQSDYSGKSLFNISLLITVAKIVQAVVNKVVQSGVITKATLGALSYRAPAQSINALLQSQLPLKNINPILGDMSKIPRDPNYRYTVDQPKKSAGWSWIGAGSTALDYYNTGKVGGAAVGCYGGGLVTLETGGWGCLVAGPVGAFVGGTSGAIMGFFVGGFGETGSAALDGAPDADLLFDHIKY